MTNFERIKAMSVEEMAEANVRIDRDEMYYETSDGEGFVIYEDAIDHEKIWLESEADNND